MASHAYRSMYGDLTQLHDTTLRNDSSLTDDDDEKRLLIAVSTWIDKLCNRHFYPRVQTRYFDIEPGDTKKLLVPDLISITTMKDDENLDDTYENTWDANDYDLLPYNADPTNHWGHPYTAIAVDEKSSASFPAFPKGKKVLEIDGLWGFNKLAEHSGSLLNDGTDINATDTAVVVDDGTDFAIGQTIELDSEQMLITDISSDTLTVVRALNGTTGASHLDDVDIYILRWPAPVERACLITTARIIARVPTFEPAFVSPEVDPDVAVLLQPYVKLLV